MNVDDKTDKSATSKEAAALYKPSFRRHKAEVGECPYCDQEREFNNNFHPPHDASSSCRSGKHSHCSCDSCF